MNTKIIITFALLNAALIRACEKCAEKTLLKEEASVVKLFSKAEGTKLATVTSRVVARTAVRAMGNNRKVDTLFRPTSDKDSMKQQAFYAMGLVEGKESEDSADLSELFQFVLQNDEYKFDKIFDPAFLAKHRTDALFEAGKARFVKMLIGFNEKWINSFSDRFLYKFYDYEAAAIRKSGNKQAGAARLRAYIRDEYFPYGEKLCTYYFSDSIQQKLKNMPVLSSKGKKS